jgi:hypothetical protein
MYWYLSAFTFSPVSLLKLTKFLCVTLEYVCFRPAYWHHHHQHKPKSTQYILYLKKGTVQAWCYIPQEMKLHNYFLCPMPPPHVLMDLVVLPPGHGSTVTDFWGWDAHEAQLRCPDDVSGDIGGWGARRALKHKFYQSTQTMVIAGSSLFRENSHGRAGNRTRDLMISSQRDWPLDHEAGHFTKSNTII